VTDYQGKPPDAWLAREERTPDPTSRNPTMSLFQEIRVIENTILYVMERGQSGEYPREYYAFHLGYLARETGLHRDIVRGVCRSLTDQGLAHYMKGLWSEEGYPAGAGYGITDAGAARLNGILGVAA
jgi:hypothetical protein